MLALPVTARALFSRLLLSCFLFWFLLVRLMCTTTATATASVGMTAPHQEKEEAQDYPDAVAF